MKYLKFATILLLAGCLGDNDPGIFGEYTTEAECAKLEGMEWRDAKYVSRYSFPHCRVKL